MKLREVKKIAQDYMIISDRAQTQTSLVSESMFLTMIFCCWQLLVTYLFQKMLRLGRRGVGFINIS